MSGIGRLHVVVDDDAALDGDPGLAPEVDVRTDAGGDDDEIGVHALAVGKLDALDCPLPRIAFVLRPSSTRMPRPSIVFTRCWPPSLSSWRSISVAIR